MTALIAGSALAGASIFVFPSLGDTIREPKWIWLWAFGILGLGWMIWRRSLPPRLKPASLVFLAYLLLQPFFFSSPALVWPFVVSVLSILVISLLPVHEEKIFDRLLIAATWIQLLLGGLQLLGWDPIFSKYAQMEHAHPLVGFLGQQTVFGSWMAPLAWYWFGRGRLAEFAACSLAVFATASAFSAFAWVFGLAAWLVWRYSRRGFVFVVVTILFLIALVVSRGQDQGFFYDNGRYLAWRMILNAWRYEPWFGYGVDSFAREFRFHQGFGGVPWIQAHNEYLELLFGGGLVGVTLALVALLPLWLRRKNWWGRQDCLPWFLALTVILANSLGNFPLHIAPLALLAAMAYFRLSNAAAI